MIYDNASWHYGGKFPSDLPMEAGATHAGMFLVWALLVGLGEEIHSVGSSDHIAKLRSRSLTPGRFFFDECDRKFTDEDLNDEGNAFTRSYFHLETGDYIADYEDTLGAGLPELYYVKDSWENFDRLTPVLDTRLAEWRGRG